MALCLRIDKQELKIIEEGKEKEKFILWNSNALNIEEGIYNICKQDMSLNTGEFYSFEICNSNTNKTLKVILTNNKDMRNNNNLYISLQDNQCNLINILESYHKQYNTDKVRVEIKEKNKITLQMLRKVFNGVKDNQSDKIRILQEMVDELNRIHTDKKPMYVHYKLDTRNRLEHFFAQCWVETWSRQLKLEESFYYSVESLKNDKKFTKEQAQSYGYIKNNGIYTQRANEKEIANIKYSNRKDLGNQGGDDGYNFRGRGMIQLTGRYNYQNFTLVSKKWAWLDSDINFLNQPNLISDNGKYAIMSAAYFWVNNKCFERANEVGKTNVDAITRIVNKNTNTYDKRWEAYKDIRAKNIFYEFEEKLNG